MNPELLAGLGAGAPPVDPGMGGGPPDMGGGPPPPDGPPTDLSPVDALREVLQALETYQGVEEDDIDLADAAKAYTILQTLLARNQKQQEQALGTTDAHRGMRRALRGA